MTSAILPARQIVKACEAAVGRISSSESKDAIAEKVALLVDLQKLAAAASEADGSVCVSLDHFSLISSHYRGRERG